MQIVLNNEWFLYDLFDPKQGCIKAGIFSSKFKICF